MYWIVWVAKIDKSNQMLANHCGPHPTRCDFVTNRFPWQKSILVHWICREFSIHICWLLTHFDKFTRCVSEWVCVMRVSSNIFIKIAPNRIFSRCKTCCVCVNYKFWKIERWKKNHSTAYESNGKVAGVAAAATANAKQWSYVAYMCKLFGILHIIYKQTIDTHIALTAVSLLFISFFGCSLIIFLCSWVHVHICNY